jgi:uncharacterized membrane protein
LKFQFTHPEWLLLLPLALGWVFWLAWKTDVQISSWRRWLALICRTVVVVAVLLALAGLQWLRPLEGMNVFFLLDRSESIPSPLQEAARKYVNRIAGEKKKEDKAGVLVFGTDAALETAASEKIDLQKILALVGAERTDIAGAVRLGTAAFPETGQKRLVLISDGNENIGDVMNALLQARQLGVTLDVLPLGAQRGNDVSVQKLVVPNRVKKGQTFEAKIFIQADQAQKATVRLFRNDQELAPQTVELDAGKNLFSFPEKLIEPGFYTYSVQVEAAGDTVPQNNQATSFVTVRGDPRVLVVSSEPDADTTLVAALRSARLEVKVTGATGFPATLGELQSYDAIFISNLAAGDLGRNNMLLLESAVRDFGVGLVCIGGAQTYAAGGYRGTPLEETLPVNMELDSKKVLPSGAVALVMHGMEFMNGNQVARDCAQGVLDALGPQDQIGVVMWDGHDEWFIPMTKIGDGPKRADLGRRLAGMNQGDLPSFQNVMTMAYQGLKESQANLKHMIVFSDGDPGAPQQKLMDDIIADKITVTTVLIAGHAGPETMQWIANQGHGRFYNVQNAGQLPQIFIKEAAVILKSAIFEEPFQPQLAAGSELVRGIGAKEYPQLLGYVCTSPKPRAEIPLVSDKGDPVLAHWQFGLGRAVAFTSDAKAKWAKSWLGWEKFRQFWVQTAQWSLKRVENADLTTEVSIDKGEGQISVDALDDKGGYRNFLGLQAAVVSPKGERTLVRLDQTGPGHYEARFPTKEVGAYVLNLMDIKDGQLRGAMAVGASVNYSPEFNATEPNLPLLQKLAESGGGKMMNLAGAAANPFLHDRLKTFQPRDLWEWLLKLAIVLFTLDVGVRRIQIDRDEWLKATATLQRTMFFWRGKPRPVEADESLAALLSRRDLVRSKQTAPAVEANPELFQPKEPVTLPLPEETSPAALSPRAGVKPAEEPKKPEDKPVSTTSRLLDAKRRAQKRNE